MKPDKHFTAAFAILMAAVFLIALTWIGTTRAIYAQRLEITARVNASLVNQALMLSEQIDRQIVAIDQTLRIIVTAWQNDPRHVDLQAWQTRSVVMTGLSRDMVMTDQNGIIRESTVTEAINQDASGMDYYRALSAPSAPADRLFIGSASIDGIMRQWHMNVARPLRHPNGSFAGTIDADYRIAAITDVFNQSNLDPGAFVALAGLDDGTLSGAIGQAASTPGASIAGTPMFAIIRRTDSGVWVGASPHDAVRRIHAFRRLPGTDLVVVAASTEEEAMRPAALWRQQATLFASCITALLAGLGLVLIQGIQLSRRQDAAAAKDRAILAASNAQLEIARAFSAAKAEQLEVTLAGMSDDVSMIDGQMRLVEWNARFPEIAGVPADILRVGLPMEEILRAQVRNGQFGQIPDPEAEVARRMTRLRVSPFGVTQRQRPDGHTVELRRNRLPDGGFVTLYADITEHKQAEEALRQATAAAETANREKSSFVAIVSHEIRTPLNALLNTIRLLGDSVLAPAQRSLLTMARQSGDALFGLIGDVLDLSQIDAGKLSIRPSLFELRPLLESSAEMFAVQAAQRGITIRIAIAEATPGLLLTDPGRLRQVQLNLLSNAVKYAAPGDVWLTAEPGQTPHEAIRLTVRDNGPVIPPDARQRLFHPFARLQRPAGEDQAGTGLGLSICHRLITAMGGNIGCDPWRRDKDWPNAQAPGYVTTPQKETNTEDATTSDNATTGGHHPEGNAFWITLGIDALPFRTPFAHATGTAPKGGLALLPPSDLPATIDQIPRRKPPRTRILLTEDIVANQVVTAILLRREGHHVDIAASGVAAIQAVQAAPYDLVFMDIFMPGLGGQEATQIIRTLPEPARSTRIVALTAHVSPHDEALFKQSGMDGILAKPASVTELLDTLHRQVWSAPANRSMPPLQSRQPEPLNNVPVLATERIEELRTNLPTNMFANLMEQCLVDIDQQLPALRLAMTAGANSAVIAHAHALAGVAAGYGMAAMEARLRSIMAAAKNPGPPPLGTTMIASLDAEFAEAARSLKELLRA